MRLTFALIAGLGLVLASAWLVGCQSGPDQSEQSSTKFEQPRYLIPQVEPLKPSEKPPEAPAGAPAAPAAGTPAAPAAPAATPAAPAAPAAPAPAPEAGK
jgi:nucleoid-associated protein YgaU